MPKKKAQVTSDWILHSPYNLPGIFLWNKKRILLDKSQFRPFSIDTDVKVQGIQFNLQLSLIVLLLIK